VPRELARPTADGTTVWVGWDGRAHASLTVADTVRPSSARAIHELSKAGLPAYLLTGDHDAAALGVAREVGIPVGRMLADMRPEDKHAVGFFLELTGELGGDRRLAGMAELLRDRRRRSVHDFFLSPSGRAEAARDFPLAARWGFRMNMDLASFRALFDKAVRR